MNKLTLYIGSLLMLLIAGLCTYKGLIELGNPMYSGGVVLFFIAISQRKSSR